ncbi:hypothetical protein [Agriterribacter sp.]|uniref:hypothetical protein n=1 Tax=Agriterribacter sp. TaxID=2821509 RepID=UPI002BF4093B|nr:hypothetical protein [Agriterribacter sp.]HRO46199.1 hypothetical protein [Agriterribacter sp.]HRQ16313.1 hypothetical protein [Agriterribacter sp.]
MKNINAILIVLALPLLLLTSCKKEYGPDKIPNFPVMDIAPVPKFALDPAGDLVIQQPEDFKSKFTLDLYFPDDQKTVPQSADVSIVMNNNYKDIRKFKTGVTTFPATFDITGADLANLFNIAIEEIVPGYKFEIRADFTLKDGTVIPGFVALPDKSSPAKSSSPITASSDVNNWPDSKTNIIYNAVCPLEIENFVGSFTANDPYFWEDSYPVTITLEEPNVLKVTGLNQTPSESMKIKIDFKSFIATVDKQIIDPAPWFFSYTNLAVQGTGTVDACNNVINLTLTWTVDQGSFGSGDFIIKL